MSFNCFGIKKIKNCILLLGVLLSLSSGVLASSSWTELKGEHFVIYYKRSKSFARKTLVEAEKYYTRIAHDLGYSRRSQFWNWDNRVKIYIFSNSKSYKKHVESMGYAEWSIGYADYEKKEIVSYQKSKGFLDQTLPHEITHLMFRDFMGTKNIPIWIDEGIAQLQEKGSKELVRQKIKKALKSHAPIPMDRMLFLNISEINNEHIVDFYYLQAISMIDFMIERFGPDRFSIFCRQLRDGKDIDNALQFAFPKVIRSADELQAAWLEYLGIDDL